jgi:hypothetical protein
MVSPPQVSSDVSRSGDGRLALLRRGRLHAEAVDELPHGAGLSLLALEGRLPVEAALVHERCDLRELVRVEPGPVSAATSR